MHAITVPQDPLKLKSSTHEVTAAIIASGINTDKSILFNQSSIKEHSELANSECSLIEDWLKSIDLSVFIPEAIIAAVTSWVDDLSFKGSCGTVIACKSTIEKIEKISFWRFTQFLIAPK